MKPIIIRAYPISEAKSEIVRLQKSASEIVAQLQRESGLSASYIVSEIIRQGAPLVQFEGAVR